MDPKTKAKAQDLGPKVKAKAKNLSAKAKAKDLGPKAKAKDLGPKVKAKAKNLSAKAKAKDLGPKAKAKDSRCQCQISHWSFYIIFNYNNSGFIQRVFVITSNALDVLVCGK